MNRRRIMQGGIGLAAGLGLRSRSRNSFAQTDATPEATPTASGIPLNTWQWVEGATSAGTATPASATPESGSEAVYTAQFLADGTVLLQVDCNRGNATYTIDGENIMIMPGITTLAGCTDPDRDNRFWSALSNAATWSITTGDSDQLTLTAADGSEAIFVPVVTGVVWQWAKYHGADDVEVTVNDPSRYSLLFQVDGTMQVLADCNTGSGTYAVDGDHIVMTVGLTKSECGVPDVFNRFTLYLTSTSFVIRGGHLFLSLPEDGGIAEFMPVPPDLATPTS